MNTQKATYWFALALAAFAFHSEYQRGAFPALHRAANCAGVTLCRMATNAERTVAVALMAARPTIPDDDLPASIEVRQLAATRQLTEDQKEMIREQVRAQAEMIRAQVLEHRGQIREMRSFARQQVRLSEGTSRNMFIVCPKTGAKVKIHAGATLPGLNLDLPELEIAESD